jgi:hypothetical protein
MKKTLLGVALALLVLGRSEAGTINTVITINNPATNISLNSSFAGLSSVSRSFQQDSFRPITQRSSLFVNDSGQRL